MRGCVFPGAPELNTTPSRGHANVRLIEPDRRAGQAQIAVVSYEHIVIFEKAVELEVPLTVKLNCCASKLA